MKRIAEIPIKHVLQYVPHEGERMLLLADVLRSLDDAWLAGVRTVLLTVDSPGGDAGAAFALYHALRGFSENGGTVVTHITGEASSSAVIYVLASDYIVMSPGSKYGIHGPLVEGEEDESIRAVSAMTAAILGSHSLVEGNDAERWTRPVPQPWEQGFVEWVDAERAVAIGLADAVGDAPAARAIASGESLPPSERGARLSSRGRPGRFADTLASARMLGAQAAAVIDDAYPMGRSVQMNMLIAAHADARLLYHQGFRMEAMRRIAKSYGIIMATGVLAEALVGQGPSPDPDTGEVGATDWAEWVPESALMYLPSLLPFFRSGFNALTGKQGRDVSLTPWMHVINSAVLTARDVHKATSDEAVGDEVYKAGLEALSTFGWWYGLPVTQLRRTGDYWLDISPEGPEQTAESEQAGTAEAIYGSVWGAKRQGRLGVSIFGPEK